MDSMKATGYSKSSFSSPLYEPMHLESCLLKTRSKKRGRAKIPNHPSGIRMLYQHIFGPLCKVFDQDVVKLGVLERQASTSEGDDFGDLRMSEALSEGLAADTASCAGDQDLHCVGG